MLKIYKIEHTWNTWGCAIEINEDFIMANQIDPSKTYTTHQLMQEMILYWSGGKQRLDQNDGDVTKTFLQQLARELMIIQSFYNHSTTSIINEFKDREGWCKLDGSSGIKIRDVDEMDIYHDDFSVEEDETA